MFFSNERSDEEYYEAMSQAYTWLREGIEYSYSKGICGSLTAGYGKLDEYGYWEYPLNVGMDKEGKPFIMEES